MILVVTLALGCGGDEGADVDPWGDDGFVPGAPIDVGADALESWVYVPIDEMRCGDGTPAGIFVNFTDASRELVFFLDGGGICYDDLTCSLMAGELEGLGEDPLASFLAFDRDVGLFDRGDEENPFRAASYVVVPHCTGDFHLADRVNTYGSLGEVHQLGHPNLRAALRRVVPTFDDASAVTAAGFSAGGVGVSGNFHLIASAFTSEGAPLPTLVNDAGPLLRPPFLGEDGQAEIAAAWGLEGTLFGWCPRCETRGFHEVFARLHAIYPELRSSLVCTYDDDVVKALYMVITGPSILSAGRMKEGLLDFSAHAEGLGEPAGGHRDFLYDGTRHGALSVAPLEATPGLAEFLAAQREDRADWTTTH